MARKPLSASFHFPPQTSDLISSTMVATQRLIRPLTGINRSSRLTSAQVRHFIFRCMSCESSPPRNLPEDDHERFLHPSMVDVTPLAMRMREQVRSYVKQAPTIRLVGLMAQRGCEQAGSELYSEVIGDTFAEDGIQYEVYRCQGEEPADVETAIQELNARSDVHGILIFYPIFKKLEKQKGPYLNPLTGVRYKTHDDWIRDLVAPEKDVEALSSDFTARWHFRARAMDRTQNEVYVPCTAQAVNQILESYHPFDHSGENRWSGVTVTVVNRSEIFGRPLAAVLALKGATVYSVDDNSILMFMSDGQMRRCTDLTLDDCLVQSSIVVTGVPSPDFVLPCEAITDATVVDVSEYSNVCVDNLLERPNVKLIPSVGKVTVAALEQNLVRLHKRAMQK